MIPKYKDIIDLVKKGSTIEAQEKIMQLREAAMELKEENLTLIKMEEVFMPPKILERALELLIMLEKLLLKKNLINLKNLIIQNQFIYLI